MTVLSRGVRPRRGGRRPGWVLLTVLLVLAIGASSALVFTNRVELLKLAVILSLWAAVAAAFVSVIYRRQSDIDQAKARDLKLVYDLQLDREISARREYELAVETQLRRELASELRAQQADEVSALRAELAALRNNLEILFEADLAQRPALEPERTTVRAYSDWARDAETTGRVSSSRIEVPDDVRTEESAIIDVAAEPQPPETEWTPSTAFGGAQVWAGAQSPPAEAADEHPRFAESHPEQPRFADARPGGKRRRRYADDEPARRHAADSPQDRPFRGDEPTASPPPFGPPAPPPPQTGPPPEAAPPPPETAPPPPEAAPPPEPEFPWLPPHPPPEPAPQPVSDAGGWRPAPAEGQWIPAGAPGSNWAAAAEPDRPAEEYVGRRRAPEPAGPDSPAPPPVSDSAAPPPPPPPPPPPVPPRGRHSAPSDATDPGRPGEPQPVPPPAPEPEPPEPAPSRGERAGGQSVAELLARLRANGTLDAHRGQRSRRRAE